MQLLQVNKNKNSFEINLRVLRHLWGHNAYAWGQRLVPWHVWPSEDTMNMHAVRGCDFSLEVKTQMEVKHAQELASDLMQTSQDDVTAKLISNLFGF